MKDIEPRKRYKPWECHAEICCIGVFIGDLSNVASEQRVKRVFTRRSSIRLAALGLKLRVR